MAEEWPGARFVADARKTAPIVQAAFERSGGRVDLLARGTPFQLKVWEALLRLPEGAVTTYARLAAAVGVDGGARAIGSAVGANPIAMLIPCHRVIRATGVVTGYRWGSDRKAALLAWEAAREV
jgi:AraC family transcriptional regulator of adaptative response/methylated-DNA-[protein]-cysteine methyltransferase